MEKKKLNQKLIKSFKQIIWSILETYTKQKIPYTVWNDQNKKKHTQNFNTWLCQFLMLTDTTKRELFPNKNFPLVNLSITDCLNASKIAKWIFNYFSVQFFFFSFLNIWSCLCFGKTQILTFHLLETLTIPPSQRILSYFLIIIYNVVFFFSYYFWQSDNAKHLLNGLQCSQK